MAARITAAGFTDVAAVPETVTFTYASSEEWWDARWSHFGRANLERLSPEALTSLQAEALTHARETHAQGRLITEMEAIYTTGKNQGAPAGS